MPQLKTLVLSRVAQPKKDDIITKQCHAFSDVTLDQLRVRPQLQSNEAVPFIDSITQLRCVIHVQYLVPRSYSNASILIVLPPMMHVCACACVYVCVCVCVCACMCMYMCMSKLHQCA